MTDEPTKTCSRCRETKPITAYYRSSRTSDRHEARCKACKTESDRGRRERVKAKLPPIPSHLKRRTPTVKRMAVEAELTRDPRRTDKMIAVICCVSSELVSIVRASMHADEALRRSSNGLPPPSPRTMRAIAQATADELRLFHPTYLERARQLRIIR